MGVPLQYFGPRFRHRRGVAASGSLFGGEDRLSLPLDLGAVVVGCEGRSRPTLCPGMLLHGYVESIVVW